MATDPFIGHFILFIVVLYCTEYSILYVYSSITGFEVDYFNPLRNALFWLLECWPATLLKKRLWHRCFPRNFVKFLKTPFYRTLLDDCFHHFSFSNFFNVGWIINTSSFCFLLKWAKSFSPNLVATVNTQLVG